MGAQLYLRPPATVAFTIRGRLGSSTLWKARQCHVHNCALALRWRGWARVYKRAAASRRRCSQRESNQTERTARLQPRTRGPRLLCFTPARPQADDKHAESAAAPPSGAVVNAHSRVGCCGKRDSVRTHRKHGAFTAEVGVRVVEGARCEALAPARAAQVQLARGAVCLQCASAL